MPETAALNRMIRLEFDEDVQGIYAHNRKVWFSVEADLKCLADLQHEITSKLINPTKSYEKHRIYLSYDGYTLLPNQSMSTLLAEENLIIHVKQVPEYDYAEETRPKKRRRRSKSKESGTGLIEREVSSSGIESVASGKTKELAPSKTTTTTVHRGQQRAGTRTVGGQETLKEVLSSADCSESSGRGKSHKKEGVKRYSDQSTIISVSVDVDNPSFSTRLSGSTHSHEADGAVSKHIHFEDVDEGITTPIRTVNPRDGPNGDCNTNNNRDSGDIDCATEHIRGDKSSNTSPSSPSWSRTVSNAPAWVLSGLQKKDRPVRSKESSAIGQHPHGKSAPPVPVPVPVPAPPPLPPAPPPPAAPPPIAYCKHNARPPLPPVPYPSPTVPLSHSSLQLKRQKIEEKGGNSSLHNQHVEGEQPHQWHPQYEAVEDEEAALEMGFENLYAPGKKKRPYSIIASQHTQQPASEQQQQQQTSDGILKIPVPRFYGLQVGERIAYTYTTLDEDNWEPVVSSPVEGSIVRIVDGSNKTAGPDALPNSVTYVISLSGQKEEVHVGWGDLTECWVLRKPDRRLPCSPLLPSSSTSCAPVEVDEFLERISVRRSQI